MHHDPDIVQLQKELKEKRKPTPEERFKLIQLYHDRYMLEEATQAVRELLIDHHDFIPAIIAAADLSIAAGDYGEAEKYYAIVMVRDSNQMGLEGFFRLALCRYHTGNVDLAQELLEFLIKEGLIYEPYYRLLLGIYNETGNHKGARDLKKRLKRAKKSFNKRQTLENYLQSQL